MPPKKPPGKKRVQRPYQKGDITIEDQTREQKNLLDAARRYEELNKTNLEIIAISFEHRAFAESKSRDEYIARIRSKLEEWSVTPDPAQPSPQEPPPPQHNAQPLRINTNASIPQGQPLPHQNTPIAQRPPQGLHHPPQPQHPQHPQQQPQPQHHYPQQQFPHSAPPPQPAFTRTTPPPNFNFAQPPPISPAQGAFPQQQQFGPFPPPTPVAFQPPQAPPIPPNGPTFTAQQFVDLFDPVFLSKHDLNNPTVRTEWIRAVWEFFMSGGTPYSTPPGASDSPIINQKSLQDQQQFGPPQHTQQPSPRQQPPPNQLPPAAIPAQAQPQEMMVVDWGRFDEGPHPEVKTEAIAVDMSSLGVGTGPMGVQDFGYLQGTVADPDVASMTPNTFESWVMQTR